MKKLRAAAGAFPSGPTIGLSLVAKARSRPIKRTTARPYSRNYPGMVCNSLDDDIERFELYRAVIEQQSDAPERRQHSRGVVRCMLDAACVYSSMRGAHRLKVAA